MNPQAGQGARSSGAPQVPHGTASSSGKGGAPAPTNGPPPPADEPDAGHAGADDGLLWDCDDVQTFSATALATAKPYTQPSFGADSDGIMICEGNAFSGVQWSRFGLDRWQMLTHGKPLRIGRGCLPPVLRANSNAGVISGSFSLLLFKKPPSMPWRVFKQLVVESFGSGGSGSVPSAGTVSVKGQNPPVRLTGDGAAHAYTLAAGSVSAIVKASQSNVGGPDSSFIADTSANAAVAGSRYALDQGDVSPVITANFGYQIANGDHFYVWEQKG